MASHRSKSLYAIKECSTCGRLYTKECCSIGSLDDKILVPEPDSSLCCAKCGTPVDGPSCRGCAFLRKQFDEDLLAYCVENGIFIGTFKYFESIRWTSSVVMLFESNALSIKTPVLEGINMRSMNVNSKGIEKKRIAEEQTAKENRSFEEMRHEEQLVDYKIKEIINDLGYKRFRGEKIDKEYERDCEIRIRKLKQDFNEMGAAKFEKRSKLTKEEKYSVAVDYMLSITSDDEDDYIPSEILLARYSTPKSIHTWTLRSRNRRTLAHNGG
ncbi:hypothetical protein Tco_1363346 [Tanacetum coccineum]